MLVEVPLRIHEPDADERHAEVRRFLAVIAGEHAETAGVDRQRLVERELGGEVGDLAGQMRQRARPPGVPRGPRTVEAVDRAVVERQEFRVGRRRGRASRAERSTACAPGCARSPARAGSPGAGRPRAPGARPTRGRWRVRGASKSGRAAGPGWRTGSCACSDERGKPRQIDVAAGDDRHDLAASGPAAERGGDGARRRRLPRSRARARPSP